MSDIDKDIIEKLEIEKQKWINKIYGVGETRIDLMLDDVIRTIKNERNELETYKKIAEKLADEILYLHEIIKERDAKLGRPRIYFVKNREETLDWARKEVEK